MEDNKKSPNLPNFIGGSRTNKKLKPVSFISGKNNYFGKDKLKEMMLLRAMRVTSDPKAIMKMAGMKKYAELSRTFDKLSMRKEYNQALKKLGMDFEWIAKGLKQEADSAEKAADRIKAFQIILKSLGMDNYVEIEEDKGTWEDAILKSTETESIKASISDDSIAIKGGIISHDELPDEEEEFEEYEVKRPNVPDSEKELRDRENRTGNSLYD